MKTVWVLRAGYDPLMATADEGSETDFGVYATKELAKKAAEEIVDRFRNDEGEPEIEDYSEGSVLHSPFIAWEFTSRYVRISEERVIDE